MIFWIMTSNLLNIPQLRDTIESNPNEFLKKLVPPYYLPFSTHRFRASGRKSLCVSFCLTAWCQHMGSTQ